MAGTSKKTIKTKAVTKKGTKKEQDVLEPVHDVEEVVVQRETRSSKRKRNDVDTPAQLPSPKRNHRVVKPKKGQENDHVDENQNSDPTNKDTQVAFVNLPWSNTKELNDFYSRHSTVSCKEFLVEMKKAVLDHIQEKHDLLVESFTERVSAISAI